MKKPGLFAIICALIMISCDNSPTDTGQEEDPGETLEPRSFMTGVSGFVPRNYPNSTDSDWQNLFDILPDFGELHGVHTGWNEGELDDEDNLPVIINLSYQVTSGSAMTPYVVIGFEPDNLSQQEADNYFNLYGEDFKEVCRLVAARFQTDSIGTCYSGKRTGTGRIPGNLAGAHRYSAHVCPRLGLSA